MPNTIKQPKNILYIEDDIGLARLLQIRLERFGYNIDISHSGEEGIRKFAEGNYDVILVDNYLPGISGIELLKTLSLGDSDTPVIFLTSSGDEKLAIEALRSGAADYMIKDSSQTYLDLLPSVMSAAYTRIHLSRQNKQQQATLTDFSGKLRLSEERLNLALIGTQTGVWDWNIETGELFWTDNLKESFGLPEGQEPSISFWMEKVHPDDRKLVNDSIQEHLKGKEDYYHCIFREKAAPDSGREWRWTLARGKAIYNPEGKPSRVIGISSDFTVYKELEEQLEDAKNKAEQANQAKTEFLATMSHEIRTPMNAIIGLADILSRTKLDDKQKELVKTVQSSSGALLNIINDLLDISRIESQQAEIEKIPFSLCETIEEVINMLSQTANSKKLKLDLNCDDVKNQIFIGDKLRVRQILTNLCGNAIKFTEKGGVSITATSTRTKNNLDQVFINVSDTGIGVPSSMRSAIFDKFVQADQTITRRFGGTGLGLAISKALALQMGGKITVESEEGVGSTFTVELHLEKAPESSGKKSSEKKLTDAAKAKPRILLVEDYYANIMVASLMLENMGYEFEVATSGTEAIEKVTADPEKFRVILMDVQMHGLNGFETTQQIREFEKARKCAQHYIIGLTAHALAGDRERCIEAGMNEYITKPINANELESKISEIN